jgi:hypothetical protein
MFLLGLQGCSGATLPATPAVSASTQNAVITLCTAYSDELQVAATMRRAHLLSASAVSAVETVRAGSSSVPGLTAICASPATETALQGLISGLAAIVAAIKGG